MKTRNTGALIIVLFALIVFVFTAACSLTVHLGGKYYSNDPVPVGGVSVEYGGNDDEDIDRENIDAGSQLPFGQGGWMENDNRPIDVRRSIRSAEDGVD